MRKVLFEKYDGVLRNCLIFDLNNIHWIDAKESFDMFILKSKTSLVLGEIKSYTTSDVVDISNASHMISNLYRVNNEIYGDVTFVKNDNGKIAREMLCSGTGTISIHGLGFVEFNNDTYLTEILTLNIKYK